MLKEEFQDIDSSRPELKKFGLAVGGVFSAIGAVMLYRGNPGFWWLLIPGGILVLLGWLAPGLLKPLHRPWMLLALIMGWLMTRLILSLLFYLILSPIAIIARLAGTEFLDLKWPDKRESYWLAREKKIDEKSTYEKQF